MSKRDRDYNLKSGKHQQSSEENQQSKKQEETKQLHETLKNKDEELKTIKDELNALKDQIEKMGMQKPQAAPETGKTPPERGHSSFERPGDSSKDSILVTEKIIHLKENLSNVTSQMGSWEQKLNELKNLVSDLSQSQDNFMLLAEEISAGLNEISYIRETILLQGNKLSDIETKMLELKETPPEDKSGKVSEELEKKLSETEDYFNKILNELRETVKTGIERVENSFRQIDEKIENVEKVERNKIQEYLNSLEKKLNDSEDRFDLIENRFNDFKAAEDGKDKQAVLQIELRLEEAEKRFKAFDEYIENYQKEKDAWKGELDRAWESIESIGKNLSEIQEKNQSYEQVLNIKAEEVNRTKESIENIEKNIAEIQEKISFSDKFFETKAEGDRKTWESIEALGKTMIELQEKILTFDDKIKSIFEFRTEIEEKLMVKINEALTFVSEQKNRKGDIEKSLISLMEKVEKTSIVYNDLSKKINDDRSKVLDYAKRIDVASKLISFIDERFEDRPSLIAPDSVIEKQINGASAIETSDRPDLEIFKLLDEMITDQANILHIRKDNPPILRVEGELIPIGDKILSDSDCSNLILPLLKKEHQNRLTIREEVVFSTVYKEALFKFNIFLQKKSISATIKMHPVNVRPYSDLKLPEIIKPMFAIKDGLVLISGQSGSGKTSVAASILEHVNSTRRIHLITIENPIEYVLKDKLSLITQMEMETDFNSFIYTMRQAQRKDPDIIFIGELMDAETLATALIAADTGHLVISTITSPDSIRTIDRVLESFSGEEKRKAQILFAKVFRLNISVKMLESESGTGRITATEILVNNPEISKLIAENKLETIYQYMENGASEGMRTFNQAVSSLFEKGLITEEEYNKNLKKF